MSKKSKPLKSFEDFEDAFDYCRELNRPVRVVIGSEIWRLFPSGQAEEIFARNAGEAWAQVDQI